MECILNNSSNNNNNNNNNMNIIQKSHEGLINSLNAENPCEETVKTKLLTICEVSW